MPYGMFAKNIQWITGSVKGEIKSLRKESFDLIIMDPPGVEQKRF